jgi:predicted amidohydrolase YtcJ
VEAHAFNAAVLRLAALPFALALMILADVGVAEAQSSSEGQADPAELVLRNGRIVTLDEALPEATALAASAGRIMAVGSDREIEAYVGAETEVIDLDGRLAIPGFIEGHGHFMSLGTSRLILDLMHVAGWDEIVDMVAAAARDAAPGEWIRGRGRPWTRCRFTRS